MSNESSQTPLENGASPAATFTPGQRVGGGRFTLIRPLGQGGMGMVWLGKDSRLDQNVALKFLPPHVCADPVALDDMRRETVRSIALSHPNIIRIHDLHETGNEVFIAMEYVDGPNLSVLRLQQPQRVFTWAFVEPLILQLCDALAYAHSERVIHRDLKPANMMLDARGRLKLADFGIAAIVSESHSRVSLKRTTSGTPTYMSPQQMNGHMPHVTDDIYALGATLYEFMTSRPPFFTGNVMHQVLEVPATPIEDRQRELEVTNPVPPHISTLIVNCLEKDPVWRPQSARAVVERILPSNATPPLMPAPLPVAEVIAAGAQEPASPEPSAEDTAPKRPWKKWVLGFAALWLVLALINVVGRKFNETRNPGSSSSAKSAGNIPVGKSVSLFNGRDLTGWRQTHDNGWMIMQNVLRGRLDSSRASRSFLVWTNGTLPDSFELKFEFFPSDARGEGNYGFLYFADEPVANSGPPPSIGIVLGTLNGTAGALFVRQPRVPPRQSLVTVPREWTACSVRVMDGRVTHTVGGQVTAEWVMGESKPSGSLLVLEIWTSGNGNMRDVGFRNIELTALDPDR